MKTRLHVAAPEHEVAYQDIVALVRKHGEWPAMETLKNFKPWNKKG